MSESDSTQVVKVQRGDERAFESLVEKYDKVIFNLAYRMTGNYEDAMDITQVSFIKVYQNIERFDPSRKFFSWLYRIACNESLNLLKKNKRAAVTSGLDVSRAVVEPAGRSPDRDVIDNETSGKIQKILMMMNEQQREILVLKYFIDLSYTEISELLAIPLSAVKSRLYAARCKVRDLLMESDE